MHAFHVAEMTICFALIGCRDVCRGEMERFYVLSGNGSAGIRKCLRFRLKMLALPFSTPCASIFPTVLWGIKRLVFGVSFRGVSDGGEVAGGFYLLIPFLPLFSVPFGKRSRCFVKFLFECRSEIRLAFDAHLFHDFAYGHVFFHQ